MINRIATQTTIHGIKEAWQANRIGRIFYAIVFTTCSVLMFLQLKGLCQAYFNEKVGTRVANPKTLDHVEVPSFYYCNDMWFPNLLGVNELINSNGHMPENMRESTKALYINQLRQNDTVYPLDEYWRKMRMQDLINGITMLPEKGRFDLNYHGYLRPLERGSDYFYARAHLEMVRNLENLIGSSLYSVLETNLEGSTAHHSPAQASQINQTHGVFHNKFHLPRDFEHWSSVNDLITKLSNRSGVPRLTLDGVCWEFPVGPTVHKTERSVGEKHRQVVTHIGGLGRQLTKLVHLYLSTPGRQKSSTGNLEDAIVAALRKVVGYANVYSNTYATYLSIATQGEPHMTFHQKIRIDQYAPRVFIKYWTKKSLVKARKGYPCADWTALDQAHCNQRHVKETTGLLCEQYLPASKHFHETAITSDTCVHDHTGLFELGKSAARKVSFGTDTGFPLQVTSASRKQLLHNLTRSSGRCPRPCAQTLFQFETTYPTTAVNEKRYQCRGALAYFLVPMEDIPEVWWGNQRLKVNETFSQSDFKSYMYMASLAVIRLHPVRFMDGELYWPCSVVEFERNEVSGEISEEYFLYSLSDLAANVGGTLGLWIGASVLSFVQIIYLCCLKKLFKRIEQHKFKRMVGGICGLGSANVRDQFERDRYHSSNKPPLISILPGNRVRHI